MKKLGLIILVLFLMTGCGKKKYIECSININNYVDNYTLTGTYKIYYKKGYVNSIEKHDTYSTRSEEVKSYLNDYNDLYYSDLKDNYGGVTYSIKETKNEINIDVEIDTKQIDVNKLIKDNVIEQDYVKLNKITTGGIKKYYQSKGAICKEV